MVQKKDFDHPDEHRDFPNGNVKLVTLNGITFGLATFEPGWKWSQSVKPIVKTESCQVMHTGYQLSGVMHVRMDDGTEYDFGPGEAAFIPPGHDAWTVGDEPAVVLDITGMAHYAEGGA